GNRVARFARRLFRPRAVRFYAAAVGRWRRWAGLGLAAAIIGCWAVAGSGLVPPAGPAAAGFGALPASAGLDPRKPVYAVPVAQRVVSFGVNVDWGDEHLPAMLAALAQRDVRVTFFPTGRWAQRRPDLVRELVARGHELGNHGYRHDHPLALADEELAQMIGRGQAVLEEIAGVRTRLFAPPYGEVDGRVARIAAAMGHWTIMWTVDTVDWRRPPPETIVQRVLSRVQPGAIVLMHPTAPTAAAL